LNEGPTVGEVINKAKDFVDRVIVVDGHSSDDTSHVALKLGVEVLSQEGKGKGMALRTAFSKIDEDIFVTIDGDANYDASEINSLIMPIIEGEADMVVGSRLNGKMEEGAITGFHKIGNHVFNAMINILNGSHISDSQSGFRAIDGGWARSLGLGTEGFEIETEITIRALRKGMRVKEVPITYTKRIGTPSKLSGFGAGYRIVKTILRCSLNSTARSNSTAPDNHRPRTESDRNPQQNPKTINNKGAPKPSQLA
jgi:dolichol-phosphate mannosyltransferase